MERSHEVLTLLGMRSHTCNPRAWEAEPGGLLETHGQRGITEVKDSLGLHEETLFPKQCFQ